MKYTTIGIAPTVPTSIGKDKYYLLFNGYAMFEMEDAFGKEYTALIGQHSAEGMNATAKCMEIMAKQGELARRAIGMEPCEFLNSEGLEVALTPAHLNAVMSAINLGFGREITDEDEEIDLILMEQQKKKKLSKRNTSE